MKTYTVSYNILQYYSLLIALYGFSKWKNIPIEIKIFSFLRLASFATGFAVDILSKEKINTNYAPLSYSILELVLVFYIYSLNLKGSNLIKSLQIVLVCVILIDLSIWFYSEAKSKSIFILALNSISQLSLCILHFKGFFKSTITNFLSFPMFWISAGLIIGLSGEIILYITNDYLYSILGDGLIAFWTFHNFVNIGAYCLFLYAIWLGGKEYKRKTSESISN